MKITPRGAQSQDKATAGGAAAEGAFARAIIRKPSPDAAGTACGQEPML